VAVLAVATAEDRANASAVARHLLAHTPRVLVASGGSHGADLMSGVLSLPDTISEAAVQLEQVLESARNQQRSSDQALDHAPRALFETRREEGEPLRSADDRLPAALSWQYSDHA
jgi:isoaspartyl peptidase/L-asparaginase-like protein (Ntn-hydrolase superfamily)